MGAESQRLQPGAGAPAAGGRGAGYGAADLEKGRGARGPPGPAGGAPEALKLGLLLGAWYLLNVLYNLDNKRALAMLPLPWFVSTFQLLFGWLFFLAAWLLRLRPVPRCHSWRLFFAAVAPQGLCHFLVHFGAVVSMSLGAVSFTHIVKAGEPALTALLSLLLLQQRFAAASYLALLPVVGGVALASCTQVDFSWASFCCAMLSNLGSSGRAILAKKVFANAAAVGCDLSPPNLYALLTVVASAAALPLALLLEGPRAAAAWAAAAAPGGPGAPAVLLKLTQSAVWYYLYNEVAYLCLQKLNPVTHAVANTLKRVFIIVAAVLVFRTPLTPLGAAGSVLAILGTLLYSLSRLKYG